MNSDVKIDILIKEADPDIERLVKSQIPIDREALERDYKLRVRLDYQEWAKRFAKEKVSENMRKDAISHLSKSFDSFSVDGRILVACGKKHLSLVRDIHYDSSALTIFGRLLKEGEITIIESDINLHSNKTLN